MKREKSWNKQQIKILRTNKKDEGKVVQFFYDRQHASYLVYEVAAG